MSADPLDRLLEAVEHEHETIHVKQLEMPCYPSNQCPLGACVAAAEVRRARVEAVAYRCDEGPCAGRHLSSPPKPEGRWSPLFSVPPATVPRVDYDCAMDLAKGRVSRETVERLARLACHREDCAAMFSPTPCTCGLDAALRELGMEGGG